MAILKTGIVQVVNSKTGRSLRLQGDDAWYGAFKAEQLNGAVVGDEISFEAQVVEKAGVTYNNIKGTVSVLRRGAGVSSSSSLGSAPASSDPATIIGAMSLSKDRSIARQNACNVAAQAIKCLSTTRDADVSGEMSEDKGHCFYSGRCFYSTTDLTEALLSIAREIEAYTTGDADKAEVMEAYIASTSSVEANS